MAAILTSPWSQCEAIIKALGRGAPLPDTLRAQRHGKDAISFLRDLGILAPSGPPMLTDTGLDYFHSKYILEDQAHATHILRDLLLALPSVQSNCQTFWGRQAVRSQNVLLLMQRLGYVDWQATTNDMGSFLALLSSTGIVRYSRKAGTITILFNPFPEEGEAAPLPRFIAPESPYSNIKNIRQTLRACKGHIYWLDKHFDKKALEPLAEESDGAIISEIRILSGPDNATQSASQDFQRFSQEMQTRGIVAEWRVVAEKRVLPTHDRWILAENVQFNVPPVNSIFRNQYGEILVSEEAPDFDILWARGVDIATYRAQSKTIP